MKGKWNTIFSVGKNISKKYFPFKYTIDKMKNRKQNKHWVKYEFSWISLTQNTKIGPRLLKIYKQQITIPNKIYSWAMNKTNLEKWK